MNKTIIAVALLSLSSIAGATSCEGLFDSGNKHTDKVNRHLTNVRNLSEELKSLELNNGNASSICLKAMEVRKAAIISAISLDKGKSIWKEAYYTCSDPDDKNANAFAEDFEKSFKYQVNMVKNLDRALAERCGAEPLSSILENL